MVSKAPSKPRTETTSTKVATAAGKWLSRLKQNPEQDRVNVDRKEMQMICASALTQARSKTK